MKVPKLRSPILLVHGLLGYDEIRVGGRTVAAYFAGIPDALRAAGNDVLVARLSPTEGVARRAEQLKAYLDRRMPREPVHVLAHSMGGLDARYMISRLGMAPRVLTLTTIATPHRGSAFADWGVRRLRPFVAPVFDWLNLPTRAFFDLTTASCQAFNEQVPDAPGVRYFSVAGRHEPTWWLPEWHLSHRIVRDAEGENDGVVSVASAAYGESREVWDGDHLSLVNCMSLVSQVRGLWRDRSPQYARLLGRLADEGF